MAQGNEGQQVNPIQMVAQNLDVQLQMHTGLAMQVGGLDAESLKRGLVEMLNSRAELIKSLRDALVTQQDANMLAIAQLAAAGSITHVGALAEIIQAARYLGAGAQEDKTRIIA